jgi:hypothetical protein
MKTNNMAILNESIAKQPIDDTEDKSHWIETALPLVRRVFKEMNKPNGVLFKRDDGQLIVALIEDGKWNWDAVKFLHMDEMKDKYDDISASNPFEWVFCKWGEKHFTTMNKKTVFPNQSFSKLFEAGVFQEAVRKDYENQYGKDSV